MRRILYLISILTSAAYAASPPTLNAGHKSTLRLAAKTPPFAATIRVVFGDKASVFQISSALGGGFLELANSEGFSKKRPLKEADLNFLKNQINQLSGPVNNRRYCGRSYIEIIAGEKHILSCLHSPNKLAISCQRLANLLTDFIL